MGKITGWKGIGHFFGVSERTARRWEKLGLPIARFGKRVAATTRELEKWHRKAWLKVSPVRS